MQWKGTSPMRIPKTTLRWVLPEPTDPIEAYSNIVTRELAALRSDNRGREIITAMRTELIDAIKAVWHAKNR